MSFGPLSGRHVLAYIFFSNCIEKQQTALSYKESHPKEVYRAVYILGIGAPWGE